MIARLRPSQIRYCFCSSKDVSKAVGNSHDSHAVSHTHDEHLPQKEKYLIEGKGPIATTVKKFLRFAGWEPDTPRSGVESTHFNEFLNIPILKQKPNSLYRYMQYMPTTLVRVVVQNVLQTLSKQQFKELNSDFVQPAQVENGVFVYQSVFEFQELKRFRQLQPLILTITLLLANYPAASCVSALTGLLLLYPKVYIPSKVFVGRMDVLPDKGLLRIQRAGWFGTTKVVYMNPKNLLRVKQDDKEFQGHAFWHLNKSYVDRDLVFKNLYTGQLLVFDKQGFWSPQGLEHPLIF